MIAVGTEADQERERLVLEAIKVVRMADRGGEDLDPRVVLLCRRITAAHDRARRAVRDALTILADPYETKGPRHTAERRAEEYTEMLAEAHRDIDRITLDVHRIAQERKEAEND